MTLKSKPQKKTTNLQIKLLYTFAINGPQSKSSLHRIVGGHENTIHLAIERLKQKEEIKFYRHNPKKHGSYENLFKITDKGIGVLSKDPRVTLEQFWEIAFCVFDKKRNSKITFKEFLVNYKKEVRKYDPQLTIFGWGIVFNHFDFTYGKFTDSKEQIEILKFLANRKNVTYENLVQYIQKKYPSTYKDVLDHMFVRLVQDKLIIETRDPIRYQVSVLGLLVLIKHYRKYLENISDGLEHKRIGNEITKIMNISNNVFPKISKVWNDLLKIIDTSNILIQFERVTLNTIPISDSIQIGGMKEILLSERVIRETFAKIMRQEFNIGWTVLGKLLKEKTLTERTPSEVYDYLLFLGMINQYVKLEDREIIKKYGNYSFDENVENALANIISFEFFTNIVEYLQRYSKMLVQDKRDNMHRWITKKNEQWDKLLQKYQELVIWYDEWIQKIINFEKKNIEILEERKFLEVRSI